MDRDILFHDTISIVYINVSQTFFSLRPKSIHIIRKLLFSLCLNSRNLMLSTWQLFFPTIKLLKIIQYIAVPKVSQRIVSPVSRFISCCQCCADTQPYESELVKIKFCRSLVSTFLRAPRADSPNLHPYTSPWICWISCRLLTGVVIRPWQTLWNRNVLGCNWARNMKNVGSFLVCTPRAALRDCRDSGKETD